MPVPIDFLRGVLGVLCVLFAHLLGRSAARVRRGERPGRLYRWIVRTVLTGLGTAWRHGMDGVMIAVLVAAVSAAALGAWLEARPKPPEEDLTHQIFPPE
ncbi:MAG TPA: hypothetical protein VN442_08890 [Bryobacteraceae bacterium]|nr:hypothetical protein [Bryobacteraceae bacterium]